MLFSAGNAKKNVFPVFIDPIVTIDVFIQKGLPSSKPDGRRRASEMKFDELRIVSIVTIGSMKTVKTFFFRISRDVRNSTAMNKKLKYSISYPIINEFHEKQIEDLRFLKRGDGVLDEDCDSPKFISPLWHFDLIVFSKN